MEATGLEIAVVGLACRLPGARDPDELWDNLAAGRESVSVFTPEELEESGVPPALRERPEYVSARGVVEEVDCFDAGLFGYSARDAAVIDPQQRLFLECAWAACEDAGLDPERAAGPVGLYAGVSFNTHLRRLSAWSAAGEAGVVDPFQALLGNDKDFLATRVAYKLNLRGPALSVQTACSTSLVAVHLACRSLLGGECDAALAGGASVNVPPRVGYLYQPGGILSPDGHCRAFDARAAGTVPGSGVGVVVLKRLADALADGDTVRAVILGSAVNNDGSAKVGYTAPSVEGQAQAIAEALAVARVGAETVSYVEAHGTGTALGDPIEVAALSRVFPAGGPGSDRCALGSVKTNLGHLDAAAGVAGLIKTVLALERRHLPPSLHFDTPNPRIDFGSRFFVNDELREWPADGHPRRAGVSSFGIGGTNAHAVLEEAPARPPPAPARPWQVLPLAARTPEALARLEERLARHLEDHPDLALADVAHTLQHGRRPLGCRRAVVAPSLEEAARALGRAGAGAPAGEAPAPDDLAALARRWSEGETVDWRPLAAGEGRRRVPLPTYPFERERFWIPPASAVPAPAPAAPAPVSAREAVEAIWRDVLGAPGDDPGADFFELGGDSLAGLQIVEQVRRRLGVELSMDALFEGPTLGELVRRVEEASPVSAPLPRPAPRARSHPLSLQQERLLEAHRRAPGSPAHHESYVLSVTGPVDRPRLAASLRALVRRHDVLRTTYPGHGREGVQRVEPAARAALRRADLRRLPGPRRQPEAERAARAAAAVPFDVSREPQLRCLLLDLDNGASELALTLHRVVADGSAMGVFFGELERLYAGPSPPPPPAVQYPEYAARQRERLAGPEAEAGLRFWRSRLAGCVPRPAPQVPGAARRVDRRLAPDLVTGLAAAARRERATLFMTGLAAWSLVLARALGREEVLVAAPVAGREGPAATVLGYVANLVLLRVPAGPGGSVGDHVRRVRAVAVEAFSHQDVPYEAVLEAAFPGAGGYAVYDAALVAQRGSGRPLALPGLEVGPPRSVLGGSHFHRALYLDETPAGTGLALVEHLEEGDAGAAEARLRELVRVLEAIAYQPDRSLSDLDLESEP